MDRAARRRSITRMWLVRFPRAMPVAAFLLIASITILSIFAIERGQSQREATQLYSRSAAIASALERRANASAAYLRAGAALLATLDEVPANRFRRFVSELRLDADYRGAEGIGWAPVVLASELDAFELSMTSEHSNRFGVYPRPAGAQPFLAPIAYLQPDTERNRRAIGFDMFSEPVRRSAMQEAERTARPTASGKIVLRQEGEGDAPGFLIFMPVFEAAPGGRQLKGYIFSPFNATDFLASALELEDAGNYGVSLHDGSAGEGVLLASSGLSADEARRVAEERISVANNPWRLKVYSTGPRSLSGLSMVTLIFGLLVAGLLMLMLRMLTQQALEDEATLTWFEEQASIRNSLTRELNHRVKNTLANVLSIIALTRRRAEDVRDFADSLDGRIRALSATHDLLTKSDWGSTPVRSVVEAELVPYAMDGEHVVKISGPDVELAPNDALSLGLAIHELATNAAKYGALSKAGGQVSVQWKLATPERVRVEWEERGGPPVPQSRGRGFGTDLIERIVAHELKQPVKLDFDPEGVRCMLTIPVRQPTAFSIRARKAEAARVSAMQEGKPQ